MSIESDNFATIPQYLRNHCIRVATQSCGIFWTGKDIHVGHAANELKQFGLMCQNLIGHERVYQLTAWGRKVAHLEVERIAAAGEIRRRA